MPIDFARISDDFREPLTRQTEPLLLVFDRFVRTLRDLRRRVDAADRATRALPLVRFRDGALAVQATRAVAPSAVGPPTIGDDAGRGGAAFVAGIAWVGTAVRQELLIPNLGRVAAELVARLETETNEVLALEPSLFSIRRDAHSLFQLPALGALGVRMAADAGALAPGSASPSPTAAPRPGGPAPTLPDLDELAELLAGATTAIVLALPVMTTVVATRVQILSLSARAGIVDRLTEAEATLLGFRNRVSEAVLEAVGPAEIASRWFTTIDLLVRVELLRITLWLPDAAGEFLTGLRAYVDAINGTTRGHVEILQFVIGMIETIMSIDLLYAASPLLVQMGLPESRLTIGDLVDKGTMAAAQTAATGLARSLLDLGTASLAVGLERDARIWFGLSAMFAALGAHDIGELDIPSIPRTITAFPDLVGRLFPPALDTAIADWGQGTADGVRIAVAGAISESSGLATRLDETVQGIAAETRRGLGGIVLADAMSAATRFTDAAIGEEVRRQRADAAARSARASEDPFLHLFTTTGFQVAGGLVPHYLAGLQRFLRRRSVRPTPTSPHVLARHGRLVAVRTDRVTVRATGRPTDAAVGADTAGQLRSAIGDLYLSGRRRLDEASAEARSVTAGTGRR